MKKVFSRFVKASKILLLLALIFSMTKVNTFTTNGKISNDSMNKTLDLTAMATKYEEIHYTDMWYPLDRFTGDLTGYAADCPLCSGKLGCTGQDVRDRTTMYNDAVSMSPKDFFDKYRPTTWKVKCKRMIKRFLYLSGLYSLTKRLVK